MRGAEGGWRTTSQSEPPRHRDGDAQPARPWRGCAGGYFRVARFGGITRFAPSDAQHAAARRPSPRPPTRGGMRAARKAAASTIVGQDGSARSHFAGTLAHSLHVGAAGAPGISPRKSFRACDIA